MQPKKPFLLFALFIICTQLFSQAFDESGYRFLKRIRGISLQDSKVQEILIDESANNVVICYRSKKIVYISIYKLYSWDKLNDYRIDDRVELYNSYFDETGDFFFMNFDVYKKLYKKIDVHTGAVDTLKCHETPRGCYRINQAQYALETETKDKYYLLKRDKVHPNDVLIYIDAQYFTTRHEQYENETGQSVSIVDFKGFLEQEARGTYGNIHQRKTPLPAPAKKTEPKTDDVELAENTNSNTEQSEQENNEKSDDETPQAGIILRQSDVLLLISSGSIDKDGLSVTLDDDVELDIIDPVAVEFSTVKAVEKGQLIKLENILFEQGSYELSESSFKDLDRLAEMMQENPNMKIQVNGHTNNIGIKNLEISEQRAKAVVDYLMDKNISNTRLKYRGFGDTHPIASNETEDGRKQNRRVEIIIVEI